MKTFIEDNEAWRHSLFVVSFSYFLTLFISVRFVKLPEIVLNNLENFPRKINKEDEEYNQLLATAIEKVVNTRNPIKYNRYYIQKKNTFYVGRERYFEITLQLADKYATKYNRVTVYSKKTYQQTIQFRLDVLKQTFCFGIIFQKLELLRTGESL